MFRPAARTLLRTSQSSLAPARTIAGRRFIGTAPPHLRSRTWKSSALRWGVAIVGIYYYNTSPVFADQPQHNLLNPNTQALDDELHSSANAVDSLILRKRSQDQKNVSTLASVADASSMALPEATDETGSPAPSDPAALEEEAEAQGAFNEETGEINWDCPCLGGMAYGPCGPQFREAFSCFVFSKEEPKGMDCIEKFKGMQECFQQHPDIYKGELEEDEELEAEVEKEREEMAAKIAQREAADRGDGSQKPSRPLKTSQASTAVDTGPLPTEASSAISQSMSSTSKPRSSARVEASSEPHPGMFEEHESINEGQSSATITRPKLQPVEKEADPESDLMPKAWHDARTETGTVTEK